MDNAIISINRIGSTYGGKCKSISINGIGKIKDDFDADSFFVRGIGKVIGKSISNEIKVDGICRFKNNVIVKKFVCNGIAIVKKDMEAQEIIVNGGLYEKGSITSDIVKIYFENSSFVSNIYGDNIEIKRVNHKNIIIPEFLLCLFTGSRVIHGKFLCSTIECTSLYVENVYAKCIKARDVVLGPGCKVDYVEYQNNYECDKGSQVNKVEFLKGL